MYKTPKSIHPQLIRQALIIFAQRIYCIFFPVQEQLLFCWSGWHRCQ